MVLSHSPWPLFCPDLALAQQWLLDAWGQAADLPWELAMLGPSLGLLEESATLLAQQPERLPYPLDRHMAFRLARGAGAANPYAALLPEAIQAADQAWLEAIQATGDPLAVELVGGIGDHLEQLSLMLPWAEQHQQPLVVVMTAERASQLERVLAGRASVTLGQRGSGDAAGAIQAMNLRGLISASGVAHYGHWIPYSTPHSHHQLVCCWRATGQDAPHSAWCRSVPFALVDAFYRRLLAGGRPGSSIVDLSHWQPWEASALEALGIQRHNPATGDVLALAERVAGSQVITIDTALAHLCAAMGQPAWVLLPRFPDERWVELHRPEHSYGQVLQLQRQSRYGDWSSTLETLPIS